VPVVNRQSGERTDGFSVFGIVCSCRVRQERTPGTFSSSGDLQGEEMAQIFVKALPRITRLLKNHAKPFIAKVARDGSVSLLFQ